MSKTNKHKFFIKKVLKSKYNIKVLSKYIRLSLFNKQILDFKNKLNSYVLCSSQKSLKILYKHFLNILGREPN